MFTYDTGPLIIHIAVCLIPAVSKFVKLGFVFFPPQREGVVRSRAVLLTVNVAVAAQECHLVPGGGSGAVNNLCSPFAYLFKEDDDFTITTATLQLIN